MHSKPSHHQTNKTRKNKQKPRHEKETPIFSEKSIFRTINTRSYKNNRLQKVKLLSFIHISIPHIFPIVLVDLVFLQNFITYFMMQISKIKQYF